MCSAREVPREGRAGDAGAAARGWRGAVLLAAVALALGSCANRERASPADAGAVADAAVVVDAAGALDHAIGDAGPPLAWVEAMRRGAWADAERGLAALPPDEQTRPEIRFARARAALMCAHYKDVAAPLDGLEVALPLLADAIRAARGAADLEVGPFERAGVYFTGRPGPPDQLRAARAFDRASMADRAVVACDRVISHEKRTPREEEEARALRLRLGTDPGKRRADARWLAIHAAGDAERALGTGALDVPLGKDEELTRAKTLGPLGKTDEALAAVEKAASRGAGDLDVCRARAGVLYKAKARYAEASVAYAACARKGGPHAAEDAFLSARALSRADRDAEAIVAFGKIAEPSARSPWAEQAAFLSGRAHLLHGRYAEAAKVLDDYDRRFKSGSERREARRYQALAHLLAKHHKRARSLLEDLASDASDPGLAARYTNLSALAALGEGDRQAAIARYGEVARTRPLSWAALVARARLAAAGAPVPPAIAPGAKDATPASTPALPPPADLLHRIGLDDDAEDALRSREDVLAASDPGRHLQLVCAGYKLLGRARRLHQLSPQIPSAALATAPSGGNLWAWECNYPQPFPEIVTAFEAKLLLPSGLVHAVMRQESGFDPVVVSSARAVGLMQVLPETARAVADHARIPHEEAWLRSGPHNITLGALYLRELLDRLREHAPDRDPGTAIVLAIGAYNAGPEAIERWASRTKGAPIDVFVELSPYLETRAYVVKVMGNLARYGYLRDGEQGVPRVVAGAVP